MDKCSGVPFRCETKNDWKLFRPFEQKRQAELDENKPVRKPNGD